jgi:hypothetical protein
MFQMLHMCCNDYVESLCSKCFICFKRMLQWFYLGIAKVDMDVGMEEAKTLNGRAATRAIWWLLVCHDGGP